MFSDQAQVTVGDLDIEPAQVRVSDGHTLTRGQCVFQGGGRVHLRQLQVGVPHDVAPGAMRAADRGRQSPSDGQPQGPPPLLAEP